MRARTLPWLLGALAASLATACVLSVDAAISPAAAIFDPRLVGAWVAPSDSARMVITRGDSSTYEIAYTDAGKPTGRFRARLGRIGGRTVLDVWPAPEQQEIAEPYRDMLIPGHALFVVEIGQDALTGSMLEPDTLQRQIDAGEAPLRYLRNSGDLILTSPTAELAAGLAGPVRRHKPTDEPSVWRRVR